MQTPKRPKVAPKPEKPHGGHTVSTADILRATGYSQDTITLLKSQGVITPLARGMWEPVATLGAMVKKLREKDAGTEDRQRKNKSEADSAEIDALKKAGATCLRSDALLYVSETRIAVRQTIEAASYLTPVQRTKLLTECMKIKIDPPEKEE